MEKIFESLFSFFSQILKGSSIEKHEHDTEIFNKLNQLLSEKELSQYLEIIGGDHSVFLKQITKIDRVVEFARMASNQFLNKKINKKTKQLMNTFESLSSFIGIHFFTYRSPTEDIRLVLYPELNIDRAWNGHVEMAIARARYEKYSRELYVLINSVRKSYEDFRLEVKKLLRI